MLSVRFLGHLRSRLLPFVCGKHQLVSRLIAVFSKWNDLSWRDSRGLVANGSSPLRVHGLGECSRQVVLLLPRLPSRERRLLTGLQPPSASYLSFSNPSVSLTALSWVLGVRTRSSNWPGVVKAGVTSLLAWVANPGGWLKLLLLVISNLGCGAEGWSFVFLLGSVAGLACLVDNRGKGTRLTRGGGSSGKRDSYCLPYPSSEHVEHLTSSFRTPVKVKDFKGISLFR